MIINVLLLSCSCIAFGTGQAHVCYAGNEPDSSGKMRWVLPYRNPCDCTEIRLGGVNMQAPQRPFQPRYLNSFVITDDIKEINMTAELPTG